MPPSLTRRQFLNIASLGAAAGASLALGGCNLPQDASASSDPQDPQTFTANLPIVDRSASPTQAATSGLCEPVVPDESLSQGEPVAAVKPVLRVAHFTDVHMTTDGPAPDLFAKALQQLQSHTPKVDVVFNTGDSVMETLAADQVGAENQWKMFTKILEKNCSLPVYHAIGNHDVWGWGLNDSTLAANPLYGKAMAKKHLGLKERYYRFDLAGWHFVVLDSNHLPASGTELPSAGKLAYTGKLDDEQFDWLTGELAALGETGEPVCILSHIPIISACEMFDGQNEKSGNWIIPGAWMHIDARRMRNLFLAHKNVGLCLSGHAHQQEQIDYLGVRYVCNGSICGNWWRGDYLDCPPGYALVDLYADGTATSQYLEYG